MLSIIAVPLKCSFPSGTLDITPHPNALSHETGEGKYTSRGHDLQNAIMGIMDQSMCCPKNFPVCATEATLSLSFPRHGPDQKTHYSPSTGQDSGRLLQTAHALSFSKHGPDIRLLATVAVCKILLHDTTAYQTNAWYQDGRRANNLWKAPVCP